MPSNTSVPPSLPWLLTRIEHWETQRDASVCINYQQTCELIISELQFVIDYAKQHV